MPYVAYANVWGLPSLQFLLELIMTVCRLRVQLISKNGNEEALFKLGEFIEKEFKMLYSCCF